MADLDDFFAKKDRKKAKGKKFTTTEEIAKKLEETGKKVEKPKPKEKPTNQEGEEVQPVEVRLKSTYHYVWLIYVGWEISTREYRNRDSMVQTAAMLNDRNVIRLPGNPNSLISGPRLKKKMSPGLSAGVFVNF